MATAIITAAALTLLRVAAAETAPAVRSLPPIGITVTAVAHISPQLVEMIINETDAIWRPSGVHFAWQRGASTIPTMLHVVLDDERRPPTSGDLPLGWIVFNDGSSPESWIHLSYANMLEYMLHSRPVIGFVEKMPTLERDTYMSRALGRALAHELGHFLLASKTHTPEGLMSTHRSATDLFGSSRHRFAISATERAAVAARLDPTVVMGSR